MYELIIIDGSSVLFRSFFAIKDMRNALNQDVGAIYGFISCVLHLMEKYMPKYIVVASDAKEKTWRHEADSTYKSNRKPTPIELIHQFQMVRDICQAFGIVQYSGLSAEADDWIASCVKNYTDLDTLIVSTDKDLLQLVSDKVHMYDLSNKSVVQKCEVMKKWQVKPEQICDLLSIMGDASDCIQGVKGIGLKTAVNWLNEYTSLDNIMTNIDKLKPLTRQNLMREGMHQAVKARELIRLKTSLQVLPIDQILIKPCLLSMKEFFEINPFSLQHRAEKLLRQINMQNQTGLVN